MFCSTAAEYIKTAPLLRLMDEVQQPYRLIDSGQHATSAAQVRRQLRIREPDVQLHVGHDIDTIPRAAKWFIRLLWSLRDRQRLRRTIFDATDGVCVVHGDTLSTLLATLMARRAGIRVAHIEAGLRSHSLLHPFPEEAVRIMVMRRADLLFAPDATAVSNLRSLRGVHGRIVALPANTVVESLHDALGGVYPVPGTGPAIFTLHRVENLHRRDRLELFVETVCRVAIDRPVHLLLHPPTRAVFERRGMMEEIESAGVVVTDLLGHAEFARALCAAPLVVTDGGSVQEEAAALGVPCLLWRSRTERPDGIGTNAVLSRYRRDTIDDFIREPDRFRQPRAALDERPSQMILDVIRDG